MQLFGFNPSKCKTQCRLGVGRIKLLRNKKQIAMKSLRKEVAELLRQNKQGSARIRVEAVMREHHMLQAFELLELYLELLAVRAELLSKTREIPPDMIEAISSLIYAGERVSTDLAEVNAVSKLLIAKYSSVYKESGFPHEVMSDLTCRKWQVNECLVEYLAVTAPPPTKKLQFLEEIAAEHGVEFDKDAAERDMLPAPAANVATYAAPVHTLAAGAGPLPLAHGWQPPAAGVPPEAAAAAAEAQKGWQPPPAAAAPPPAAAAGPADQHYARVLSGGTVWHRAGAGASPGVTVTPGPKAPAGPGGDGLGWQPPKPEDVDRPGRAFQQHVGQAAAWRQVKLHGASPEASISPSEGSGDLAAPAAAAATAASATQPVPQPYPPPAAARLAGSSAQSSGGSTPSLGEKPVTPGSSYADASAAAEAARRYSQMAQQAAQRAEEFASSQAAHKGGSDGGGDDDSSASGSGGGGGGAFVPRTLSQIQRAYDAAPGPPSKADALAPGPPSAPPAAPPASEGSNQPEGGDELDMSSLPSPPVTAGRPAQPPPAVDDDLDELTKRFEMLKRR